MDVDAGQDVGVRADSGPSPGVVEVEGDDGAAKVVLAGVKPGERGVCVCAEESSERRRCARSRRAMRSGTSLVACMVCMKRDQQSKPCVCVCANSKPRRTSMYNEGTCKLSKEKNTQIYVYHIRYV